MADRTIKPDDTNDLVLQNNDGSAKLELNEDQTVKVTTGSDAGEDFTVNSTQLVVEGDTGKIGIGTNAPQQHLEIHDTSNQAYVLINGGGGNGATTSALQLGGRSASGGNALAQVSSIRGGDTTGQLVFSVKSAANTITESMRIDSSGNLKFNSGFGSVGTAYGCRAWVNFDGTGTVVKNASGNVSTITDNGTGDYTLNFTTSMPDTNYVTVAMVLNNTYGTASDNSFRGFQTFQNSVATGSIRILSKFVNDVATGQEDEDGCFVAVFR